MSGRCKVWKDGSFWEWRCPCCSDEYPLGGGGTTWDQVIFAVGLHLGWMHGV